MALTKGAAGGGGGGGYYNTSSGAYAPALSFSGGGYFPTGLSDLGTAYSSAYNAALATNTALYNNINQGYAQAQQRQYDTSQAIQRGYTDLTNQVLQSLVGYGNAQRSATDQQYAQQLAAASQQLTNAGLNNTTVTQSVNRGYNLDQARAQNELSEQFAKLDADYRSSLGLAGLGYQDAANRQATDLSTRQLDWMNTIQVPYPDMNAYASLAGMYGQMEQADADRALLEELYGKTNSMGSGGFGGGLAASPTRGIGGGAAPSYGSSVVSGPSGAGGGGYSAYQQSLMTANPYAGSSYSYNNVPNNYYDSFPSNNYDMSYGYDWNYA